jgi:excisionase family DNA binding protein
VPRGMRGSAVAGCFGASSPKWSGTHSAEAEAGSLPLLLNAIEVAELLRTTRRAVYVMAERGQFPGVTRIGTRLLFRRSELLRWLDQKCAPSRGDER